MAGSLAAFSAHRAAINAALQAVLQRAPQRFDGELSEPARTALERLQDYSLRDGKRLRGSLAAATYDAAAGTQLAEQGVQLGVALELMQNYLLIIDDVMDKSVLRRGKPTVHELYLQDDGVEIHEAQMMAVNIGQLAQHLANLVVADIGVPDAALRQTMQLMHTNIIMTGMGQIDDLYQQLGRDVSSDAIMRKYRAKNSYYTFINPMQCGFALAGKGDAKTLERCRAFGLPAGVAFQLHDDMLGVFADTDVSGKPNLDDIREGKYTLLVQYALECAGTDDKSALTRILGSDDADENDLQTVRAILERSGARQQVRRVTEQCAAEAKQTARESGWAPAFSQLLGELVDFSIARVS